MDSVREVVTTKAASSVSRKCETSSGVTDFPNIRHLSGVEGVRTFSSLHVFVSPLVISTTTMADKGTASKSVSLIHNESGRELTFIAG